MKSISITPNQKTILLIFGPVLLILASMVYVAFAICPSDQPVGQGVEEAAFAHNHSSSQPVFHRQ